MKKFLIVSTLVLSASLVLTSSVYAKKGFQNFGLTRGLPGMWKANWVYHHSEGLGLQNEISLQKNPSLRTEIRFNMPGWQGQGMREDGSSDYFFVGLTNFKFEDNPANKLNLSMGYGYNNVMNKYHRLGFELGASPTRILDILE